MTCNEIASTFTKIFVNETQEIFPIKQAPEIVKTIECRASGFVLLTDRAGFDHNGNPCRNKGGWSCGHVRNGNICAGAGGLASLPVVSI